MKLTFDDVLIAPRFSTIASRKDVSLIQTFGGLELSLPIIASNMDTVTGVEMAKAMTIAGGTACLHRFGTIEETCDMFTSSIVNGKAPMVSIGLGKEELNRAVALYKLGASHFVIDVAHGAQQAVVDQAAELRGLIPTAFIVVGNFATSASVMEFIERSGDAVSAVKIGVGPGSACTTRIKTGCGYPQLSAIKEIAEALQGTGVYVIADGGMKTPGDIAKALGAGAHLVMLGGMLAGTDETPGITYNIDGKIFKKYRGSASQESYVAQGKTGTHRTAEGESFYIPAKGPVANILQDIEGGIRSAMTYVGAPSLYDFRDRVEFVQISPATAKENGAHGKM